MQNKNLLLVTAFMKVCFKMLAGITFIGAGIGAFGFLCFHEETPNLVAYICFPILFLGIAGIITYEESKR
jgi:hypothetical protein